jgi:hypothetical protein
MTELQLYTKIIELPEGIRKEVSDFIDFLLARESKKKKAKRPVFGCAAGQIRLSDDFDHPLDDFKEYMK